MTTAPKYVRTPRPRITPGGISLMLAALLVIVVLALIAMHPAPARADSLTAPASSWGIEAGPALCLAPRDKVSLSGAAGLQLGIVRGHKAFGDGLLANGYSAAGISASLRGYADDDGRRAGLCAWREGGATQWALYLRQAMVSW